MSDPILAARGRAARARGNSTELLVARWLRVHGFPNAVTSRSTVGHGGTKQAGGDLVGVPGLAIEVKGAKRPAWAEWLRQTELQAATAEPPAVGVLVWRRPGIADVGQWLALVPGRWGPWYYAGGVHTHLFEHEGATCRYAEAHAHAEAFCTTDGATPVVHHVHQQHVVTALRFADLLHPDRYAYLTRGELGR